MKKFILVHEVGSRSTKEIIIPVKGICKVKGAIHTVENTDEEPKDAPKRKLVSGSEIYLLDKYKGSTYSPSSISVLEDPKTIYNLIYNKKDIEIH